LLQFDHKLRIDKLFSCIWHNQVVLSTIGEIELFNGALMFLILISSLTLSTQEAELSNSAAFRSFAFPIDPDLHALV